MIITFLRRFKFLYSVYNFFHKDELSHNTPIYKQLGLNKNYFSPVSSHDFKGRVNETKEVDLTTIRETHIFKNTSDLNRQSIEDFKEKGFCILKSFMSIEQADKINEEVDRLLREKKIKFGYGGKIMFAIHRSEKLRAIANHSDLIKFLGCLLGGNAVLFQSINFIMGSEQDTHSDSIHMTTYPLGGLLGVWIALEDINVDNGPLHYYPGSHKLPYYLNEDYKNEGNKLLLGGKSYSEYEKMIEEKIGTLGIKKEVFKAKKGDVLIWHANLFHGGEEHLNKNKSRKSMVLHYFKEGSVCYHEITQRPALIKKFN